MNNILIILNKLLISFWFTVSMLSLLALLLLFILPLPNLIYFSEVGLLLAIANLTWYSLIFFFTPLGIISIVISCCLWFKKDKIINGTNNKNDGLPIIITAVALFLIFVFIARASYLDASIKSGFIKIDYIGGPLDSR